MHCLPCAVELGHMFVALIVPSLAMVGSFCFVFVIAVPVGAEVLWTVLAGGGVGVHMHDRDLVDKVKR